MTPRIIKLGAGEALYCNQDLVTFVRQALAAESSEMKPGDNIYFFKDVKFKRDRLDVSAEKFNRTILLSKANVVVVSDIFLPTKDLPIKGGRILDISLMHEAEDVVFNISSFGANYVKNMLQWLELSQLSIKPRIIHERDITKYVNSGMTIDETNVDSILTMIQNDATLAVNILENCDIAKSLEYIAYLLYFHPQFNVLNTRISSSCENCMRYLRIASSGNILGEELFRKMLSIPDLRERVTAEYLKKIDETIHTIKLPTVSSLDVNISWQ